MVRLLGPSPRESGIKAPAKLREFVLNGVLTALNDGEARAAHMAAEEAQPGVMLPAPAPSAPRSDMRVVDIDVMGEGKTPPIMRGPLTSSHSVSKEQMQPIQENDKEHVERVPEQEAVVEADAQHSRSEPAVEV